MSDPSEFQVEFDADEVKAAAHAAADVDKLADSLDHLARSAKKVPSKTLVGGFGGLTSDAKAASDAVVGRKGKGIGRLFSPQQFADLKNHANAVVRLNKAHTASAPLSRAAGKALQFFGVSGAPLRRLTIDSAKTETALKRLYRVKGGGIKGGAAVFGAMDKMVREKTGGASAAGGTLLRGAGSVAGMAATGGLVVGAAALAGVTALGVEMVGTALKAEQLRFALDRITNGKGQEWWKTSSEYARKFGMDVNQVAASLMGMQATGLSGDTTKEMFQRFADMRSQGVNAQQIDLALLGFKQMMSNGVVQMEDLKQVTENLMLSRGLVMETLAKQMGKTVAEVTKLQGAGQLKSTDMMKAISAAIGIQTKSPEAGGAGAAAVNATTLGAWEKLKAVFSVRSAEALGGDALKPMRDSIVKFTSWLDGSGGKGVIEGFGGIIAKTFTYLPSVIDKVIWLLDTGIPTAWQAFVSGLPPALQFDQLLSDSDQLTSTSGPGAIQTMQNIGTAAADLATALMALVDIGRMVGVFFYDLWHLMDGVPILGTPLNELFGSTQPANDTLAADSGAAMGKAVASSMAQAIDSGVGDVSAASARLAAAANSGMASGLYTGAPGVFSAGAAMGYAAYGGTADAIEAHSPARKMDELGVYGGQGFAGGLNRTLPMVADSGAAMGAVAAAAAGRASSSFGDAAMMSTVLGNSRASNDVSVGAASAIETATSGTVPGVSGAAGEISAGAANIVPATAQGGIATLNVTNNFTIGAGATHEEAKSVGVTAARSFDGELSSLMRRLNYSAVG